VERAWPPASSAAAARQRPGREHGHAAVDAAGQRVDRPHGPPQRARAGGGARREERGDVSPAADFLPLRGGHAAHVAVQRADGGEVERRRGEVERRQKRSWKASRRVGIETEGPWAQRDERTNAGRESP